MKIALASAHFPESISDALRQLKELAWEAAGSGAIIICFPETYIPGYPLSGYQREKITPENQEQVLVEVCRIASQYDISIILPMDWHVDTGMMNVAFAIDNKGNVLGYQSKNQLDPTEDTVWIPGTKRQLFEVNGLQFGITICHEGFRYPESVRWAAMRGASVVFHPHCTASNLEGAILSEWGNRDNPYYEKAMMMRAMENTIYFASVNYAGRYQDSATSLIAPDGKCIAHQPYGKKGVLIVDIDPAVATGLLAKRFNARHYN
jgi:predicted amidohydrolase